MSDTLFYRMPGTTEIVRKTGTFRLLSDSNAPSGFVVSDFLHQKIYCFQESATEEEAALSVREEEPVVISRRDYQIEAQALLHGFTAFGVEKAVYSRVKKIGFPLTEAHTLFDLLAATYPDAFVYLISAPGFGTWIGATPETLVRHRGEIIETMALAGTHKAEDTGGWTRKEMEEHAYVVQAIADTLLRNDCTIHEQDGPHTLLAGPVSHLLTRFGATQGTTPVWNIAMDLHPTPAVCGTPRMASLDLLLSREMHERSLYAGVIGVYSEKESRLFVNLRCAQLQEQKAFLYVGGGYTIDSVPDVEWDETENKSRTLMRCMDQILKKNA